MARQRVLIDSSILIDHLRKKRKDKTRFFELAKDYDCVISSITEFEFSVGSTPKNREFTEKLLAKLPVLPFDSACVQSAVEIYRTLKNQERADLVTRYFYRCDCDGERFASSNSESKTL